MKGKWIPVILSECGDVCLFPSTPPWKIRISQLPNKSGLRKQMILPRPRPRLS